jgi:NitT/TauT family transport system permease protein
MPPTAVDTSDTSGTGAGLASPAAGRGRDLRRDLAGLDALEQAAADTTPRWRRAWSATWPKLAAAGLALLIWQVVVWSEWKDEFLFPPPAEVFSRLGDMASDGLLTEALANTLRLGIQGYVLSLVIGCVIGALVARVGVLRAAFGSLITGIQTMPSVAWVPWAILLFRQTDATIIFVVVLGTTPAIANGLIAGSDQVPPLLLRAGRALGARGVAAYRHVILPASLPGFVNGLKQGWAFAWRSLMAGEIISVLPGKPTIGGQLQIERGFSHADGVMAMMLVILAVGILIDALVFSTLERRVARRWGLAENG